MATVKCTKCDGTADVSRIGLHRFNTSISGETMAYCKFFQEERGDPTECPYLKKATDAVIRAAP